MSTSQLMWIGASVTAQTPAAIHYWCRGWNSPHCNFLKSLFILYTVPFNFKMTQLDDGMTLLCHYLTQVFHLISSLHRVGWCLTFPWINKAHQLGSNFWIIMRFVSSLSLVFPWYKIRPINHLIYSNHTKLPIKNSVRLK